MNRTRARRERGGGHTKISLGQGSSTQDQNSYWVNKDIVSGILSERPTLSLFAENKKVFWRAQIQATLDQRARIYRLGGRGQMWEVDETREQAYAVNEE
ncbi:hypothetical protein GJ744_004406 [Endocarpon pusillum]|uniref:Uncharacterized protein n=1 Tax=Endocarpon pusillum TaxID=364733 RepID=A0A8H7AVT9_9EURO|nr:hypothetical protein GJ744_004406 [Endocarpon pusillum]